MDLRDAAREQCDFSGIFHSYIHMELSAKVALRRRCRRLLTGHGSSAPPRSRAASHAAVDHELRPCHVVGRVGGEEQHAIRDVLSLSSPAERHPGLATSFGSIGTLRPPDPDSFVQIGVSMTPG
jgi:hypothetical protein